MIAVVVLAGFAVGSISVGIAQMLAARGRPLARSQERKPDAWTRSLRADAERLRNAASAVDPERFKILSKDDQFAALIEVQCATMLAASDLDAEANHRVGRLS